MLLQPDQPKVRLLVPFLLGGAAQLLFLLVLHPPRQPDDWQGERLLLHTLRQLLQEHHHVWQLRPQHQVLDLNSEFCGSELLQPLSVFQNCPHCSRKFVTSSSRQLQWQRRLLLKVLMWRATTEPVWLFLNCPPFYLSLLFCSETAAKQPSVFLDLRLTL